MDLTPRAAALLAQLNDEPRVRLPYGRTDASRELENAGLATMICESRPGRGRNGYRTTQRTYWLERT